MVIGNIDLSITGRICRIAQLKTEYYEWLDDPHGFLNEAKAEGLHADVFTFLQNVTDRNPRFHYPLEWDSIAILPVSTYEHWWTKQIKHFTRNRIKRARKRGVEVRTIEFTDDLVRGIADIYNESPLRQGKPFKHYGKDFETLKREHITYQDKCDFIGAYLKDELIGFAKVFHGRDSWSSMHIISKISQRDKSSTNALVAKMVELCAQSGVPYLQYGVWSRRGLGDFKIGHGFERMELPRYYVPLNFWGKLILKLTLHRKLSERLPGNLVDYLAALRGKWYSQVYGS